ncbi:tyrosine-type recombinase/integrase [Zunongwangia profunda]|jgi:integrase|uniref:tyrosine-type recombinase/integrase n=1 Tax=Zunongwangia profunda TaxID=398743 RepID=UPI00248E3C4F|nr:tyrosine-type recombinase/integrase [Zunongwangia profunda]|tara:strand:+ start:322 stop:1593 length:1272 start_codon:yes stop_codon:yes gene_type:complete
MTSTFYLKEAKTSGESLIYFSCYFKEEGKKFVYSTGEKIAPELWDQKNKLPIMRGKKKAINRGAIKTQLGRYENCFKNTRSRCIEMQEDFTSQLLKKAFDEEFKKAPTGKNIFFDAFDEFVDQKIKNQEWKKSTEKRYQNIRNLLVSFQSDTGYKLSFSSINSKFHADFTHYCMEIKGHVNNTYSRNLGLFKTFMHWAFDRENGYTYNEDFKKFKKKERVVTQQIALKKEDLQNIMQHDFKANQKHLVRVRDVFVFACVTGLRFGELGLINKANVIDGYLHLKEEKGAEKESRTVPLGDLAMYLLRKYDFRLPVISNQKQNEYIKDVFEAAGYTHDVEKNVTKGKDVIRTPMKFYERISTHTARRTFITMLKREGKSDKLISKITGHRDLKTLNQYYQVDDDAKKEAITSTFNIDYTTMKKVR